MSIVSKILTRGVLPVGIIALGLGCAGALFASRPTAESQEPTAEAQPVEVIEAQPREVSAVVQATGSVEAARSVVLTPEVSGRVTFVDARIRPGGSFAEGETLLRIDPRDYRAQLAADEARLAQARLELALEEKRQLTAKREWELLGDEAADSPLALRKPHLEVAQANVRSAEAAVERSQKNLSRTSLRAPFNAVVASENVEEGQVVSAQSQQLMTLVGTDAARVSVSVPVERLSSMDIPGFNADYGSRARVILERAGGPDVVHEGQVTGVSGQLDPQTRTATVVVEVPDPRSGDEPLLPGSFVKVELVGRPLEGAVPVPRRALATVDSVWLVVDGKLAPRTVDVGWRTDDEVFITDGLAPGDRVVLTPPSLPIAGMPVVPKEEMAQQDAGGGDE